MWRRLSLAAAVLAMLGGAAAAQDVEITLPADVLPPLVPEDNPLTAAKVELGKKLYFDGRLSADGSVSCATCHDPRHGFAEPRPVSIGVGGAKGVRNAPTAFDAAFLATQFWDGRAATLEEQARGPIVNPVEMALPDEAAAAAKLAGDRRVPAALREGLRGLEGEHGPHRPGDRELRAHAGRRAGADRPLRGRRRQRDLRGRQAGLGALQRQGALQQLPRPRGVLSALHRRPVPQHRRGGEGRELRGAGAQGAGPPRGRGLPRPRGGPEPARAFPRHQAGEGHRRLQDAAPAQRRADARPTCTTAASRRSRP